MPDVFTDTWSYRGYDLTTEPLALGDYAPFVEKWRAKLPGDDRLPAWSDYRIEELFDWWGRISLLRYQVDPVDIRCDLWGTIITDWFGQDYTNRRLGEPGGYANWRDAEKGYYEELRTGRLIGVQGGELTQRGRYSRSVWSVDLPIRNSTGTLSLLSLYVETEKGGAVPIDAEPVFETTAVY